jgi:hypothetical protein
MPERTSYVGSHLPYRYLDRPGSMSLSEIKITDANGEVLNLSMTESIMLQILIELRAMRLMLSESTDIVISNDEITNIMEDNDGD